MTLISTLNGPFQPQQGRKTLVLATKVVCDMSAIGDDVATLTDTHVTLRNLWEIKTGQVTSTHNTRLDSPEDALEELSLLMAQGEYDELLVLDTTTTEQGRSLSDLSQILSLHSHMKHSWKISIAYSTSCVHELAFGTENPQQQKSYPACIACAVSADFERLRSAATIHSNEQYRRVPIFVEFPAGCSVCPLEVPVSSNPFFTMRFCFIPSFTPRSLDLCSQSVR
jgi:hypothetical protein